MIFPQRVKDWAPYYRALYEAGVSDVQIGELAGINRVTVNAVRHGRYPNAHDPGYSGGMAVLERIVEKAERGHITKARLKSLGFKPQ